MTAPCADKEPMLHALLDGELDAVNAAALETHIQGCAGCAQAFAGRRLLRGLLCERETGTRKRESDCSGSDCFLHHGHLLDGIC